MPAVVKEIRSVLRTMRSSPGFSVVALLALALGIGANTAMLSLGEAFFLRPLSGPHAAGAGALETGQEASHLMLLLIATGLLLLIALAHLVGAWFARTTTRGRFRKAAATGTGPTPAVRPLLAESGVVALLAGSLGLLFSSWARPVLNTMLALPPAAYREPAYLPASPLVMGYAFMLAIFAALAFGAAPAPASPGTGSTPRARTH